MAIGVQTDMCTPALARFGSDELRREFLAPAIAGDMVGCIGVSEPGGGSDVAAIKTTARKDGDDYVINGSKMWITNSLQADWMCLLANTSDGAGAQEQEPDHRADGHCPGITQRRRSARSAWTRRDTGADLLRRRARAAALPHRRRRAWASPTRCMQFQEERLWGAASIAAQRSTDCIDQTIDYARERQVFGKSMLDNQVVHFQPGRAEDRGRGAARADLPRAASSTSSGKDVTELASMAKLKAGRLQPRGARQLPAVLGRHGLHAGTTRSRRPVPRRPPGLDRRRRRRGDAGHHLQARRHAAQGKPLMAGFADARERRSAAAACCT